MKLSVAMCTYNGETFIKEQIDSILNQILPIDEIIVCDDGSNDKTIEILNQYANEYPNIFKIFQNEINLRSVKNFEKAINLCSGDIIFLSDQDDIWTLNKTEEYINLFNKNPKLDVIASNGFCIDEKSNVQEKYAVWDVPEFLREKNLPIDYFRLITHVSNLATGASMAFRKTIVSEIMPFPVIENFHHDEWIAIISSRKRSFELLKEKYLYYRIHNNQQVGGVFYSKTEENKTMLTNIFDLFEKDTSLVVLKKRLKKLCASYERNQKIIENTNVDATVFEQNLIEIERIFEKINKYKKRKYPISSFVLNYSDKALNKRQLNKKNKPDEN
jgi:glycosyltransferase involved in cell wall biosynthesis